MQIEARISADDIEAIATRVAEILAERAAPAAGPEPLISEQLAAAQLGVNAHTLRDARKRGEIRAHKIGRFIRYDRDQLAAFLGRAGS
jgi:excisionase family DNA binding protein